MTTNEELRTLQQDLEVLQEQINTLKAKIKEPTRWDPEGGEWYIFTDGYGRGSPNKSYTNFGMEFSTKEAVAKAHKAYKAYHRLYKLAEELNKGWEPDWTNDQQAKYYILLAPNEVTFINKTTQVQNPSAIYFASESVAREALVIIQAGGLDETPAPRA